MLYPGLYEQVINNALNRELAEIPEACKSTAPIDTAEAAKVLAQYLTDVVQKGLENVQAGTFGIVADLDLCIGQRAQLLNGFYVRSAHIRGGDDAQLTAALRKLPQLVHDEAQAAPLDKGDQHINAVGGNDLLF